MPYFIFAFRGILGMWRSCWDSSSWLYRNSNLSSLLGWVPFFSSSWPSVCLDLGDFFSLSSISLRWLWLCGLMFMVIFSSIFMFECQRDWTLIQVEYAQHFVTIHFNALASQSGHICLARYVASPFHENLFWHFITL